MTGYYREHWKTRNFETNTTGNASATVCKTSSWSSVRLGRCVSLWYEIREIYDFPSDCRIFLLIYEIFFRPSNGQWVPVRLIQRLKTRERFFFTISRVVKIHKLVSSLLFLRWKRKCFYRKPCRPTERQTNIGSKRAKEKK